VTERQFAINASLRELTSFTRGRSGGTSVHCGNTGCVVAQDLALLIKVRTLIREEISLLTVLYFPFISYQQLLNDWYGLVPKASENVCRKEYFLLIVTHTA